MRHDDSSRRALVIFTGLMRSFEQSFRAFERTVILPNRGYAFEIAVATSVDEPCSAKDYERECCECGQLDDSPWPWASQRGDVLLTRIRAVYGKYMRYGAVGKDIFLSPGRLHNNQQHARLQPLLAAPHYELAAFSFAVVTRPDAVLVSLRSGAATAALNGAFYASTSQLELWLQDDRLPTLDLEEEVQQRPGFSIVTSTNTHGNDGSGLNRDLDFMYLAPTPSAVLAFFFTVRPNQTSCACGPELVNTAGGAAAGDACVAMPAGQGSPAFNTSCPHSLAEAASTAPPRPGQRLPPQQQSVSHRPWRSTLKDQPSQAQRLHARQPPPPVPPELAAAGMVASKLDCAAELLDPRVHCRMLEQFARAGLRIGTLEKSGIYTALLRPDMGTRCMPHHRPSWQRSDNNTRAQMVASSRHGGLAPRVRPPCPRQSRGHSLIARSLNPHL